jgi:lysine-ketoglutarate reductase/saccharopine dehydrogenase-like protein (TIGR00300 family)
MDKSTKIAMCPPKFFDVNYVINPWMEGNIHNSSRDVAEQQWNQLHSILSDLAEVQLIDPQDGLPDMVFTANAGLVLRDQVVLSRFFHPERQGEEAHFKAWFAAQGFTVHELPKDVPFEGAGDALLDREGNWLWAGYGFRSELASHLKLAEWLELEVISLHLVDERFYHLDTCFCPLHDGYAMYYPPAFDAHSNRLIEMRVAPEKRIPLGEADAELFACNAVNVGKTVVVNRVTGRLRQKLEGLGLEVIETPMSEFMKAGGAAKCLTLRTTESVPSDVVANPTAQSRKVKMEGHLLDSGMISKALDTITDSGGSFQVLEFDLGAQRHSTSKAEVMIAAPTKQVMDEIISQLVDQGAIEPPEELADAELMEVTKAGVAPDDFYVTNIYPTEVRVDGQWIRLSKQRMDGAVAVKKTASGPVASCRLMRDLEVGDLVAVGSTGLRTVRKVESRSKGGDEFGFMGAGVSSERKVEIVVERIAWELRQIRERGGKVVVVAGPVVIHTGGSQHLSELIRQGYIQVLLGGNAIAVHDIEQSLLGTSLGVDMQQGVAVRGGHRHHLRAINVVRRCGDIAAAVEQGVLKNGVMFECVKNNVAFSLAGSIRDDGPLPDTKMDLIEAQSHYSELIQGADLILMLSSMLHSIGVGNMTPAGVKMVCVDINPAVVTKLADRGSVESIGVVTDVGLFLSLLAKQLAKFAEAEADASSQRQDS